MLPLKILFYPDARLKEVALPVTVFDDALRQTIKEMFALMYEDGAVGLAATQVGSAIRLFVMDASGQQNEPLCLINPEILEQSNEVFAEEGCASFPGIYAKVLRPQLATIKFQDEQGNEHIITKEGIAAHCIHHEIDHLNGIVFIDHLSKLKRMMAMKKYQKLQRAANS